MAKLRISLHSLFLTFAFVLQSVSEAIDTDEVCSTDVCKKTAQIMRSAMNVSADPCGDFYEFSCGKFMARTVIPQGQQVVGPFYDASTVQILALRSMLDNGITSGTSTAQNKAVQFYRTCVDSISSLAMRTKNMNFLKQMLTDFFNGWPLTTHDWNSESFDFTTALARIASQLDQGFYVAPMIIPDRGNSSKYTLTLAPQKPSDSMVLFGHNIIRAPDQLRQDPITGLPIDQGYSNYQQESLTGIIRQVACTIDPDCAKNPNLYYDVTSLSNMLFMNAGYAFNNPDIFVPNRLGLKMKKTYATDDPEVGYRRVTIPLLNMLLPEINWQRYFNILFEKTDFKVEKDFKLLAYVDDIAQLLDRFRTLSQRELALLLGWHVVIKYGQLFSPQLRAFLYPSEDQNSVCLAEVNKVMGYAVGSMYNQKYVQTDTIKEVKDIVADLKKSFREMLVDNSWMDDRTKSTALKKIDRMGESVAAPDWTRNNFKLDHYYSKLSSDVIEDFPTAFKEARIDFFSRKVDLLKRSVNSNDDWPLESTAIMNAMYYVPANFMYYFSGILQFPFYVKGLPRAVNYGSFGYVAGHEITHGFDTAGRTANEFGEEQDWWDEDTSKKFESKADCFINQYGSIQEPTTGMPLNGVATVGENIADNGGIRAAFKAYKNNNKAEGGRLYGLEQYTEDQLFFMSAALTYCTTTSPEFMQQQILSDEHSPNKYRAVLPLLNSEDFAKAFNCPVSSPMNPNRKCRLW